MGIRDWASARRPPKGSKKEAEAPDSPTGGGDAAFAERGRYRLPAGHSPLLVLPDDSESAGFSCLECAAYRHDGERHSCASPDYRRYFDTDELVHPATREPLTGAQVARTCSDWFTPKK